MTENKGIITFGGKPLTILGDMVKVGDKAQDFTVMNNELKPVKLSDYAGKVRVLSVMPSIDTPVCANQTRRFNKEAANLDNVQIMTLSVDLPFALARFCGAEGIDKAVTLSDYNGHDFAKKYGFLIKELNLLARGVIIIDANDEVKYVEYVPEIGQEPDYEKALEALKSL